MKQPPWSTAIATNSSTAEALALECKLCEQGIHLEGSLFSRVTYVLAAFVWVAGAPKATLFDVTASKRLKSWNGRGHGVCFLARCSFLVPMLREGCWLRGRGRGCQDIHTSEDWEDKSGELEELHCEGDC
jgi:hypothetical protein